MFTGIIQGTGTVLGIVEKQSIHTLQLELPSTHLLETGASVSIDGVCLTAVTIQDSIVEFDVISETLTRTTLGHLSVGQHVNVERSLKFGDEIGGHLLSGHIMATGILHSKKEHGEGVDYTVLVPENTRKYVMEKGYIAIDGISLTIGKVDEGAFSLHIIPETLRLTTLVDKEVGDAVNLEIDSTTQTIVATVERVLEEKRS
ncbi:MAG: riboflavin synthase subunit alpha [Candidatus Poseidoniaceae archaeon]|jgi:riboflavin synthase|tara:strand:+ start:455 stop:1060 length:606 start_codon:yes stop_codon:yes gene_type:complete